MSTVILSTGSPDDLVVELAAGRPFLLRVRPRSACEERPAYDVIEGFFYGDREFDTENYRIARFGPDLVFAAGAQFELRFTDGDSHLDTWVAPLVDGVANFVVASSEVAAVRATDGARVEWWLVEPGKDDYLVAAGSVRAL